MSADIQIAPMATIDGKLFPLTECTWVKCHPCGCASGVALAEYEPSEDAAWKAFTAHETAREVAAEKAAGATMRLMLSTAVREGGEASLLMTLGNCTHEPKWGRAPLPDLPTGHVWAVRQYDGRNSYVKHAVALGEPEYPTAWSLPGKAMCGAGAASYGKRAQSWYADNERATASMRIADVLRDALPCTTCLARLAKLTAGAA